MFFGQLHQLASAWEAIPLERARERYDLLEASHDSVDHEVLFGDAPEHFFVHHGDITVEGSLALKGEEATVYVVDGDLTVNGTLRFESSGACTSLLVTGSVVVENLFCLLDCCLFIGGSLTVRELLLTYLNDAGHLVVDGSTAAAGWLDTSGRGAVCIEEVNKVAAADFVLPEFLDDSTFHTLGLAGRLVDAALEGRPLLSGGR